MSTENSETEMQKLVSEAYQGLPKESVPEHLNQAIIKQATTEATRSRSYRFAAWRKPVAWTAIIALSLAFVLELAELQTQSIPETVTPASPPASNSELRREDSAPDREFSKLRPARQPDAMERAESVALPMSRKASVAPIGCDEATRKSADAWKECIQTLRESGAVEMADREYEAYILAYPPQRKTNK